MSIHLRWFDEVWNKGNEDAITEMSTPDVVAHGLIGPEGNEVTGVEDFKRFWRTMRAAFSDVHVAVEKTVTEGDFTVARLLITGRHTGEGLPFPPTGNPVQFTGMSMVRVSDGKIAEAWNNIDFMAMYQQAQGSSPGPK